VDCTGIQLKVVSFMSYFQSLKRQQFMGCSTIRPPNLKSIYGYMVLLNLSMIRERERESPCTFVLFFITLFVLMMKRSNKVEGTCRLVNGEDVMTWTVSCQEYISEEAWWKKIVIFDKYMLKFRNFFFLKECLSFLVAFKFGVLSYHLSYYNLC